MKTIWVNVVTWIALLAVSVLYLQLIGDMIRPPLSVLINLCLMPLVLGGLGAFFLTGSLGLRLLLLALIPVGHVLILGGDAAKPGLERVVALLELIPLLAGATACHFIMKLKKPKLD
jgi:hypothetical protein